MYELDMDRLEEFRDALTRLTKEPELFKEAALAVEERSPERFQAVLARLKILRLCFWICRWYCVKTTSFICVRFCPDAKPSKPTIEEMMEFAEATIRITANREAFTELLEAYRRTDVERFSAILQEFKLMPFCIQFCRWFAYLECTRICRLFCPRMPVITHVGNIPTSQIDHEGYASGPSQPPYKTGPPDVSFPAGRGDHPFGGSAEIRGLFYISSPEMYKVEYSEDLSTWKPITEPVKEWNGYIEVTRYPTGSPDPGWYKVSEMWDVNYLTDWRTPSGTGKWYLRLIVKTSTGEFISEVVAARVDNEKPDVELQPVMILLEDGTERPISCGGIKKGEGKILIRFKATDPNFRTLTLVAEGGGGISRTIVDETTGTHAGRSYEGDLTDTGEPPWRTVIWDPWQDPIIEKTPCCYLIVLRIWDRTITNNYFAGGHYNRDHDALEIAI